jgi:hypothetical protein
VNLPPARAGGICRRILTKRLAAEPERSSPPELVDYELIQSLSCYVSEPNGDVKGYARVTELVHELAASMA